MARTAVVRYTTTEAAAQENQRLVEDVYAELAGSDPGGLRYATFRLADGVSFIHIAVIDDENPLERSSAFAAFQRQLADRVIDPPAAVGATLVGSYRFLTESGSTGT